MKNQSKSIKSTSWAGRFGLVLAGLTLVANVASAATVEVKSPAVPAYGYSYAEWSAKWWEWSLGQDTNSLQLVGSPNICAGAASKVRFLTGVYIPAAGGITYVTNKVTIEPGTPLFFPILSVWVDNSGCPFTTFTVDQLAAEAAGEWSAVTTTSCSIDGKAVAGLEDPATTEYLVQSPPFSYTTATKDNVLAGFFGSPCIGGDETIYPAIAQGVYLMLEPLSAGKHTIHLIGVVTVDSTPVVQEDITYDIVVN